MIESGIGNCFTILTSCPGTDSGDKTYVSQEIREKMDGEVRIEGFNDESKNVSAQNTSVLTKKVKSY